MLYWIKQCFLEVAIEYMHMMNIRIEAALHTSREIAPRPFQVKWIQDLPNAANQGSSLLLKKHNKLYTERQCIHTEW